MEVQNYSFLVVITIHTLNIIAFVSETLLTKIFGSNIPSQQIKSSGPQLLIKFKSYPKNGHLLTDIQQGKFLIKYQSEYNGKENYHTLHYSVN